MKRLLKIITSVAFVFALLLSCNSGSYDLKKATKDINKLTEKVNKAQDAYELQKIGMDFQTVIDKLPANIQELSEEEALKLEGGEEFLKATLDFASASAAATTRLLKDVMDDYSNVFNSLSDDDD